MFHFCSKIKLILSCCRSEWYWLRKCEVLSISLAPWLDY